MSVYDIITKTILDRINKAKETGEKFYWVKPWTGGASFPESYTTRLPYRGINRLILPPGEYITYKALMDYKKSIPEDEAVFVKKGSRKNPVFFYGKYDKQDEEGNPLLNEYGNPEQGYFLKFYQVFCIEDIKGLHSHYPAVKTVKQDTKQTKLLDKYIKAYVKAENLAFDIVEDGSRCFYAPESHTVRVPAKEGFRSTYSYYSAVLHELVHSTSRGLNRFLGKEFGNDAYMREELIAQIGSQMLLSHFKIVCDEVPDDIDNDIAYIDGWATRLKEKNMEIAKAAAQAEKAIQYFLDVAERKMKLKKSA